ncbi:hypothetical protein CRE_06368 [Caenorhabditis remanei]|uniref:Uncharacterized protein n=1 Tax=Caenorhabditis remanei TaxID=31234 RepID=E3M1S3_CAERE|nr:hypothetical protein CRE_06368 [Caenorhabditis remanei]
MQPIPLYPILGGFCTGFLAVYLDVWAHYLMAFIVAAIVAQIGSLAFCFFKKHQTIGKLMNRHVFPEGLYDIVVWGLPMVPVTVFVLFLQTGMRRSKQMNYINKTMFTRKKLTISDLSILLIKDTIKCSQQNGVLFGQVRHLGT